MPTLRRSSVEQTRTQYNGVGSYRALGHVTPRLPTTKFVKLTSGPHKCYINSQPYLVPYPRKASYHAWKLFSAESGPPLGELTKLPRSSSWLGRGILSFSAAPRARRLIWCLLAPKLSNAGDAIDSLRNHRHSIKDITHVFIDNTMSRALVLLRTWLVVVRNKSTRKHTLISLFCIVLVPVLSCYHNARH